MPAATAVISSPPWLCRFVPALAGLLFGFVLLPVFFIVRCNGIYFTRWRSPASPENQAVVLRIEPLRVSPLPGFHPSPRGKGTASGGLAAPALSPFAVGELQGRGTAISAGDCLRGWVKGKGGLT
ncbi:hypothetical protein ACQ9QE_004405, partial [Cronobacter sakazakii]